MSACLTGVAASFAGASKLGNETRRSSDTGSCTVSLRGVGVLRFKYSFVGLKTSEGETVRGENEFRSEVGSIDLRRR